MSLIQSLSTGTYQVTRKGPGIYQDGFYIAGPDETICVEGSLQPTTAQELKLEEEGTRLKSYYYFFTDVPILAINTKSLSDSDRVTIDGEKYKVLGVAPWKTPFLAHYMSTLVREPEQ
jgi:hypothetical protein